MAEPLLIFTKGGGRLANQLLNVTHLLAWHHAIQPGYRICVMSFWPFTGHFDLPLGEEGMLAGKSPVWLKTIYRIYQKLPTPWNRRFLKLIIAALEIRTLTGGWQKHRYQEAERIVLDLEDTAFNARLAKGGVHLLSGWLIRSWRLVKQEQTYIRAHCQPMLTFRKQAEEHIAAFKRKHELVIGIQIRHTDYRHWREGKYFYPTTSYVNWMKEIAAGYGQKKVGFLITSDEVQDEKLFEGLSWTFSSGAANLNGHFMLSIMELSLCDIIIGPNSTFSAWASFYGNKPLYWISDQNFKLSPAYSADFYDLKDNWLI